MQILNNSETTISKLAFETKMYYFKWKLFIFFWKQWKYLDV